MDEITFEDMLSHYQNKLQEASDEIQSIRNLMKQALGALEAGWSGAAAQSCRLKLETVNQEIVRADGELSEAMTRLSAIGDLLAEEEIPMI